jgi:hypothetical protein
MPRIRTCPRCHSTNVHRSHRRRFFERRILPLVLRRPYRCHNCNWRFVDFIFWKTGELTSEPRLEVPPPDEPAEPAE